MFQIQLFTTCEWCLEKLDSSIKNSQQLYCSSECQHYHKLHTILSRVLAVASVNVSKIFIDKEWKNLFDLIYKNNICMYRHRRDDIGFEISWLTEFHKSSMQSYLGTAEGLKICEHLEALHYFLGEIKK